jgi:hypothetical protein
MLIPDQLTPHSGLLTPLPTPSTLKGNRRLKCNERLINHNYTFSSSSSILQSVQYDEIYELTWQGSHQLPYSLQFTSYHLSMGSCDAMMVELFWCLSSMISRSIIVRDHQDIYQTYKSLMSIEVISRTYWKRFIFTCRIRKHCRMNVVNHITLQRYQHLYIELKTKGMLNKYSVNDYIQMLTDLKKLRTNDRWDFNEITNNTQKMFAKLGFHDR